MTPTHPYAMVQSGTPLHQDLSRLGWVVTDSYGEWLHMEPGDAR